MIESRLINILRAFVNEFVAPMRYQALVRYRVVSMTGDRVTLQIVNKASGWPDLVPCPVMQGAAGYSAQLTPGSTVLVSFIESDPGLPVITHFAGPDGAGFVPVSIAIGGTGAPAARVGDQVTVYMPPLMPVTGTVSGAPFVGTCTIVTPMQGLITSGSTKVTIGS